MSSPWRPPFEAALQRSAPQTEVQVASVSPEGAPSVRTVALRGLSAEGCPYFFTDTRSRKAEHLLQNPRVALHAWFPLTREQFRLSGLARLHGRHAEGAWAELRTQAWAGFDDASRLAFVGPPPGRAFVSPVATEVPALPPPEFLVVSVDVIEADWVCFGEPATRVSFRLLGAAWVQQALTP